MTDEGGIIGVSEVSGENIFGELLDALDNKAFAIFGPANHVTVLVILNKARVTSRIS